jgi:hypothetical protein
MNERFFSAYGVAAKPPARSDSTHIRTGAAPDQRRSFPLYPFKIRYFRWCWSLYFRYIRLLLERRGWILEAVADAANGVD